MPATSSEACRRREPVTLRGGYVVDAAVVRRLLDLERRGARFELLGEGRFRVDPPAVLTPDDIAFLRMHRDEARRVLEYEASLWPRRAEDCE